MQTNRFRRTLTGVVRVCSLHHEPEQAEPPPATPHVWNNATEMFDDQFPQFPRRS